MSIGMAHDTRWDEAYVYLTTDQREIKAGDTQRTGGWHVDGLQGTRYQKKLPVCYQFIVADREPTEFAVQPFDMDHVDCATDNFFTVLSDQVQVASISRPPAMSLVMMNAYSVHRSPAVLAAGPRTLVRIEISRKRADRQGNTRNPFLPDQHWDWQPRPIPPGLRLPKNEKFLDMQESRRIIA
jgi:hypothetical protein